MYINEYEKSGGKCNLRVNVPIIIHKMFFSVRACVQFTFWRVQWTMSWSQLKCRKFEWFSINEACKNLQFSDLLRVFYTVRIYQVIMFFLRENWSRDCSPSQVLVILAILISGTIIEAQQRGRPPTGLKSEFAASESWPGELLRKKRSSFRLKNHAFRLKHHIRASDDLH